MSPSERHFSKLGAVAAFSGLVIYAVSNPLLHPQTPPHETEAAFAAQTGYSDVSMAFQSGLYVGMVWVVAVGVFLYRHPKYTATLGEVCYQEGEEQRHRFSSPRV